MKTEMMKLSALKPYAGNAKKHDETQIKNVMQSIKDFGIIQPLVVDKDNTLIIGHCRLIACKRLKLKEAPVVRLEDLTEEQTNKLRLEPPKMHPTMKPIELIAYALNKSSKKNDVVLDCFGGSGSTLIACEQLNRKCYMAELDSKYVSVILQRYINFKGSDEDVFLLKDGKKIPYSKVE